jgi:hypothetical protein
MMKHYAILTFSVDENDMVDVAIDHSLILNTFGGVVYDTEADKWLSPSQLSDRDAAHDAEFLRFLGNALHNAMPSDAVVEKFDEANGTWENFS